MVSRLMPGVVSQTRLALNGFFPDNRPEQRGPSDPLGLFEGLVESRAWSIISRSDLTGHSKDGIEGPRGAFSQTFVCVVRRIEKRDEEMTSGKETE